MCRSVQIVFNGACFVWQTRQEYSSSHVRNDVFLLNKRIFNHGVQLVYTRRL